jgi:DNA-binding NtrC family response regulator
MRKKIDKSKTTVLIVDDDEQIARSLAMALKSWTYKTLKARTISEAAEIFAENEPQIILLDIELPDGSGLDFLTEIKQEHPETIVVMVTGNVDVKTTIAALRGGAHDFISKPIHLEELRVTLRNSVEMRKLRREVKIMRRGRTEEFSFKQILGESEAMKSAIETATKVAASDVSSVLLQGETGTGKDLFARAIHFASERCDAPYLAINCAALPANLIESELFGYEKGAFTDAKKRKEGLFEQADGGTLFLDEIGEVDISLQAKLLRVLEEGRFRRIGGLKEIPIDVRVVAASNRDLKFESTEGNFRLDLFYRISVIQIDIPPLRDRGDDVLLLAKHYINLTNQKRRGENKLKGLAKQTEKIFRNYEWLGNVRELKNVIERASILEDGKLITPTYLPRDLATGNTKTGSTSGFRLPAEGIPLQEVELDLVRQAVARTGGNLTQAAKLLHVSRDQMRYRLKKDDAENGESGLAKSK